MFQACAFQGGDSVKDQAVNQLGRNRICAQLSRHFWLSRIKSSRPLDIPSVRPTHQNVLCYLVPAYLVECNDKAAHNLSNYILSTSYLAPTYEPRSSGSSGYEPNTSLVVKIHLIQRKYPGSNPGSCIRIRRGVCECENCCEAKCWC